MKNTKMKQSIAALAMAAVVAVSLLGYGCGSKPASTTGAGATGDFTGTAKGFGGDVTVTLTLTDGAITGCTAEGKDETGGRRLSGHRQDARRDRRERQHRRGWKNGRCGQLLLRFRLGLCGRKGEKSGELQYGKENIFCLRRCGYLSKKSAG